MSNILKVVVGAANIHDTIAGCGVFRSALEKYPSILGVCGDAGFRGAFVDFVLSLGKDVIFLRRLCQKVGRFCLSVGVWSARLVGLQGLGDCLRIMK